MRDRWGTTAALLRDEHVGVRLALDQLDRHVEAIGILSDDAVGSYLTGFRWCDDDVREAELYFQSFLLSQHDFLLGFHAAAGQDHQSDEDDEQADTERDPAAQSCAVVQSAAVKPDDDQHEADQKHQYADTDGDERAEWADDDRCDGDRILVHLSISRVEVGLLRDDQVGVVVGSSEDLEGNRLPIAVEADEHAIVAIFMGGQLAVAEVLERRDLVVQ